MPVLLFCIAAGAAIAATTKPIASLTTYPSVLAGQPGSVNLNGIRETVLPNGLTVLTKEVHTAPVVYFSVFYHVGSVDEEIGQTGMSHLMEHMMFKGTKTRGPGVISSALQRNGANFNASTSYDRTEYHEVIGSDRLDIAMQIESDRMVNSMFDEAQHNKEMSVVRSEYEAGENDPGKALEKAVRLAAYQINPYRWETIGFRADIERFTRAEMYPYYQNFYTPNNAVVVVVGDIDTPKTLEMIRHYFGIISGHPVKTHFLTPEPRQEGERRVTVSRVATAPQVLIAYHIPGFGDPDHYALDILETVLSGGRTSRFFQDLEQPGIASGTTAYDYGLHFPDLLWVGGGPLPGHTNEELEKALEDELDKLKTTPITQEELDRAYNQAEAGYIFGKESVGAQGRELGENAMRGDWRSGETYLAHLRKVTPADVQRVAQTYLVDRNRTVGYFIPIAPKPGQIVPRSSGPSSIQSWKGPNVDPEPMAVAAEPSPRRFFHLRARTRPLLAAPSGSHVTVPTRVVLSNGLTIIVEPNHANPTVSISGALLSAGGVFDPADKPGLAGFTAGQLSSGTKTRSLFEIARTLEDVGAQAGVAPGGEYISLGGHALRKHFDLILDILADELRNPSFPDEQIESSRRQGLEGIAEARSETGDLADIAFHQALYPKDHPYWEPDLDTQEAALKSYTRQDLIDFYNAHYGPNKLTIIIVGDVTVDDAVAAVKQRFGDWASVPSLQSPSIPEVPMPGGPAQVKVIPVADKAQTDVVMGYQTPLRRSDKEFYTVVILDTILGGGSGLTARLGLNVRDRLGLVYGISAGHDAGIGPGPFVIGFGANPENVDDAIDETRRQVKLLHDKGATAQEVSDAVAYITGSYPVALETNAAVARQLLIAQVFGLGPNYIQERNSYYKAVTLAKVNAAAKKYLHPGAGVVIISGSYTGKYASH